MVEYVYHHSDDQDVIYAAERLLEQLDELIIENYTNNSVGAYGLSIYAPSADSWYDTNYEQGAWAEEHQWNSLLASIVGY
jgi:DNA primase